MTPFAVGRTWKASRFWHVLRDRGREAVEGRDERERHPEQAEHDPARPATARALRLRRCRRRETEGRGRPGGVRRLKIRWARRGRAAGQGRKPILADAPVSAVGPDTASAILARRGRHRSPDRQRGRCPALRRARAAARACGRRAASAAGQARDRPHRAGRDARARGAC